MVGTKPSIHLPPLLSATLARHDRRSATVSITFVSMLDFNGLPASAPLPCKITRAGPGWQRLRPKMKQIWDNGRSVGCKRRQEGTGIPNATFDRQTLDRVRSSQHNRLHLAAGAGHSDRGAAP